VRQDWGEKAFCWSGAETDMAEWKVSRWRRGELESALCDEKSERVERFFAGKRLLEMDDKLRRVRLPKKTAFDFERFILEQTKDHRSRRAKIRVKRKRSGLLPELKRPLPPAFPGKSSEKIAKALAERKAVIAMNDDGMEDEREVAPVEDDLKKELDKLEAGEFDQTPEEMSRRKALREERQRIAQKALFDTSSFKANSNQSSDDEVQPHWRFWGLFPCMRSLSLPVRLPQTLIIDLEKRCTMAFVHGARRMASSRRFEFGNEILANKAFQCKFLARVRKFHVDGNPAFIVQEFNGSKRWNKRFVFTFDEFRRIVSRFASVREVGKAVLIQEFIPSGGQRASRVRIVQSRTGSSQVFVATAKSKDSWTTPMNEKESSILFAGGKQTRPGTFQPAVQQVQILMNAIQTQNKISFKNVAFEFVRNTFDHWFLVNVCGFSGFSKLGEKLRRPASCGLALEKTPNAEKWGKFWILVDRRTFSRKVPEKELQPVASEVNFTTVPTRPPSRRAISAEESRRPHRTFVQKEPQKYSLQMFEDNRGLYRKMIKSQQQFIEKKKKKKKKMESFKAIEQHPKPDDCSPLQKSILREPPSNR